MNQPISSGTKTSTLALWAGIVFSFLFTGVIWLAGQWLADVPHLPDAGASWYYWILPQPTFWSRATAWGGYLLHQIASWGLIYYAQTRVKRYTTGLHLVNVLALATNALFILLHFVQTHIWYDGLAQDTSIFSSQGSVIIMLVWVLLMENSRRGMFFGKRVPIAQNVIRAARTYHGYVFSWATIYTFWYHPLENSSGHLIGFVYMFMLLLQGSLFYTRAHLNRWWTFALEVMVLFHGTLVALMQSGSQGIWPMFFFGFFGIVIITQMHGLGLSKAARWALFALYAGAVVVVYNWRGWDRLNEIARIPLIEYAAALVLAGLIWLTLRLIDWFKSRPDRPKAIKEHLDGANEPA
ncbi:MAG TPA: hypothetical protein VFO07_06375 [Roseiflexaceae bacterium]|nr:hypothetical protein [Roseiflexaceae bacterium]